MYLKLASAAGALALAAASPAAATIVIDGAPPYPPNPDEKVLLGGGALDPNVTGLTDQTNTLINFTGSENLLAKNGQRIEAADGGLTFLDIGADDPSVGFSAFEFKLDAAADGTVDLTFYDQDDTPFSQTFDLDKNGANFFNATTLDGQLIKRVTFTSTSDVSKVGQIRVSVADLAGGVIPEPATWAMMLAGFFGSGALIRSRQRRVLSGAVLP